MLPGDFVETVVNVIVVGGKAVVELFRSAELNRYHIHKVMVIKLNKRPMGLNALT